MTHRLPIAAAGIAAVLCARALAAQAPEDTAGVARALAAHLTRPPASGPAARPEPVVLDEVHARWTAALRAALAALRPEALLPPGDSAAATALHLGVKGAWFLLDEAEVSAYRSRCGGGAGRFTFWRDDLVYRLRRDELGWRVTGQEVRVHADGRCAPRRP